jgi:hypothetical protein
MLRTALLLAALTFATQAMAQPCSQFRFWRINETCETKNGRVCVVTQTRPWSMRCEPAARKR